jgi:hypothetical protein
MTVPTSPRDRSVKSLRRRRSDLVRNLPPLDTILRGSLIERFARCGKPNCKCANGPGHGPKHYLSVSMPKSRPHLNYVPQAYYEQVSAHLDNFIRIRAALEEICEINRELLRRRERL